MTQHDWWESSGTTLTCRRCGCVQILGYSAALPEEPSLFSMWMDGKWTDAYEDGTRIDPPCHPERG